MQRDEDVRPEEFSISDSMDQLEIISKASQDEELEAILEIEADLTL